MKSKICIISSAILLLLSVTNAATLESRIQKSPKFLSQSEEVVANNLV